MISLNMSFIINQFPGIFCTVHGGRRQFKTDVLTQTEADGEHRVDGIMMEYEIAHLFRALSMIE